MASGKYTVLMTYPTSPDHVDGEAAVLEHNVTLADAKRAVRWQGGDGVSSVYPIVTMQNGWPIDSNGKRYRIRQSPYTAKAFQRIALELGLVPHAHA